MLLALILLGAAFLRVWRLDQLPPGLNHDEAVNALDVERIIAGWRPVFLPSNNGREALFMYLQAIVGAVLGVTPLSLRLTAAFCGLATVGATYGLARRWYRERVALLAAGLLAVAFWHVVLSRVGLRAILVPLFYLLVFWALGAAWRQPNVWRFALAGVLLGLAQYTYISARLLPAILLPILVLLLWRDRRQGRRLAPLLGGLATTVVAAIITATPEALYFLRHPEGLVGRTDQVLVFNAHPAIIGQPITLQESIRRTFNMFWVAGDTNWLHNIAGLPVLDPLLTLLFLVGVAAGIAALVRGVPLLFRQGRSSSVTASPAWEGRRDLWPALWLAVWMAALLAGSSVTQESPNYLRLTALMPAVAIVCALGAEAVLALAARTVQQVRGSGEGRALTPASPPLARAAGEGLQTDNRWLNTGALPTLPGTGSARMGKSMPISALLSAALLCALVLGEGVRTYDLYFVQWAAHGEVYTAYDTDIKDAAAISRRVTDVPMPDTMVQLDASSPFLYYRPESSAARWLREYSSLLMLPPAGQPGLWIYAHFQQTPPFASYFPTVLPLAKGDARPGHPSYFLYKIDAATLARFRQSFVPPAAPATFGGALQLVGVRLAQTGAVQPGEQLTTFLLWRVLKPGAVNYGVSIHLTDNDGYGWAQDDRQGMERNGWRVGDEFVSRHDLTVPDDAPPIPLHLDASAALLDPLNQPATVLQPLGAPVGLGTVQVGVGAPANARPTPGAKALAPGLYATDTHLSRASLHPGDPLTVSLHWLRTAALPALTPALELVDAQGRTVARQSGAVGDGALPLAALPAGRPTADRRTVTLPAVLPAGPLQVVLTLAGQDGAVAGRQALGTVQVQDRAHNYTVPTTQHPLAATFGDQLALLGYDLSGATLQPGGTLTVMLDWRALRTPDLDYTVFVHLLDAQGKIVAQNDSQPARAALPTRGWLPREVVADAHSITLPAALPVGTYRLEIGWYDAATGKRLLLAPPASGDHLELPTPLHLAGAGARS